MSEEENKSAATSQPQNLEPKQEITAADQNAPGTFQHSLPKNPVEVVKIKKNGGITIPKLVRQSFPEDASFAFWREGTRLFLHYVTEEEVPQLNIPEKVSKKKPKKQEFNEDGTPKKRRRSKKSSGPQPDLTKYFPFPFENQDKVAQIFETTFYKLAQDIPNIEEAISRMRYALINYTTGRNTNDGKLFNSVVNFIADAIGKMPNPEFIELILFIQEKITPNIKSTFLKEQSMILLFSSIIQLIKFSENDLSLNPVKAEKVTPILARLKEEASAVLSEILSGIQVYTEYYAIMQGFKLLINNLTRGNLEIEISLKQAIGVEMERFNIGYEESPDPDAEDPATLPLIYVKVPVENALALIDLFVDLHLIEDAHRIAKELLAELDVETIGIEHVRAKISELSKKNI